MTGSTHDHPVPAPVIGVAPARATADGVAVITMAVAALAAETLLIVGASSGRDPWVLFAGHLLVAAVLAAWALQPGRRTARHAVLLWIATLAFGPFGPGGVLLAMALETHYARRATSPEEWHAHLFPPSQVDEHAELWRRVGQRATDHRIEPNVTPFLDVLAFGSIPQKQAAIAIIAQQFHPAFAPALKAALRDQHNVVRVQAATAIARLEQEFLERTVQLETAVRDTGGADAQLALARHYDAQAFGGLLDATREQECRLKAAAGYQHYVERCPDDHEARFQLARLHQRRKAWSEAEQLLRPLVAAGHPSARIWLMENLFEQRRYAELRQLAAGPAAPAAAADLPEVSATLALWANQETAA